MLLYIVYLIILLILIDLFLIFKKENRINLKLIDNIDCNHKINDKIDVVITWVDSSDKFWIKQKNYYLIDENKNNIEYSKIRFPPKNNECLELYYCVSSIKKYMKWVNKIYIVTCFNQKPFFIDNFQNIIIIDHTDIIPEKYLPTFNSHVIECYLHKIKGLTEKFIYFNDDFFVNRSINKNFFFFNEQPIITGEYKINKYYNIKKIINLIKGRCSSKNNNYKVISECNYNNLELINSKYYVKLLHVAIPLTITLCSNIEKMFEKNWKQTSQNKFRSVYDIRPIYLISNFGKYLVKKKSVAKFCKIQNIEKINKEVYLFCINNTNETNFRKLIKWFYNIHKIKPLPSKLI